MTNLLIIWCVDFSERYWMVCFKYLSICFMKQYIWYLSLGATTRRLRRRRQLANRQNCWQTNDRWSRGSRSYRRPPDSSRLGHNVSAAVFLINTHITIADLFQWISSYILLQFDCEFFIFLFVSTFWCLKAWSPWAQPSCTAALRDPTHWNAIAIIDDITMLREGRRDKESNAQRK